MWHGNVLLLLAFLVIFPPASEAVFEPNSTRCAPGQYWCQDRCGSIELGDSCCITPDGQHNLCGPGMKNPNSLLKP